MTWIIKGTDLSVYLLLLIAVVYFYYFRKSLEWQRLKKILLSKKRYKIALIILFFYAGIGFLDCIHLKTEKALSVLDYLMPSGVYLPEKTYSAPSFSDHLLGTDKVGRDIFYMTIKSIRTGLIIGTITSLFMLPFALLFGLLSGYFRGWLDDCIQYLYTTLSAIPGVLLIAACMLCFQTTIELDADFRLLMLCMILGLTSWTNLCRLIRAETLKLREAEFIQNAIGMAVSNRRILLCHILPNLMHIVLITVVLDFSGLVLAETILSYVGVGVDPTTYSWGNLINASRLELAREPIVWWPLAGALVPLFFLVFSVNLVSDAIQEALNPRVV